MPESRMIGKYEILEELGRGGFAVVYKARDVELDRVVALKVLRPALGDDPDFAARFKQEARAAARLKHPHIVTVYDAAQIDGQLIIAMQYVEGRTLRDELAQGQLPFDRALAILEQIADALDYAHLQGVVHRDVKPANILLEETRQGVQATLLDFGLAKAMEAGTALTSQGTILGSPEYMAPEQADPNRAHEIGPATDRYALGIVAYQLLTGRVPFPGNTSATLNAQLNLTPPDPHTLRSDLPPKITVAVLKMLAKAPADRYANSEAFIEQLRAGELTTVVARHARPQPAQRTRQLSVAIWIWIGLLVVLLVAGLIILPQLYTRLTTPPSTPGVTSTTLTPHVFSPNIVVSCTIPFTTTESIGTNTMPAHAAILASYTGLSLFDRTVFPGEIVAPVDNWFILSNAVPSHHYRIQAVPDLFGNYSLGLIVYDSNLTPIFTDTNTLDGNDASFDSDNLDSGRPYYFRVFQASSSCTGGSYHLLASELAPTITPSFTPEPLGTPTASPTLSAGSLLTRTTDGMTMVYVPAGTFKMGSDSGKDDEKPVHDVTLDAFWIDRTEVTNAQYAQCVSAGKCNARLGSEMSSSTRASYYGNSQYDDYPVIYMTWEDADKYCKWVGSQLPTEAQWEYAARGPQNYIYPWGNNPPDETRLNYDWKVGNTTAVGSYPTGASWVGALDLNGNVLEWVNDWYGPYSSASQTNPAGPGSGDFKVLRSGSWDATADHVGSAHRDSESPTTHGETVGFRCVVSPGE